MRNVRTNYPIDFGFFLSAADLQAQPGAGISPVVVRGGGGDAQRPGGLLIAQTGEETQLDQVGLAFVSSLKLFQGFVEGEQIIIGRSDGGLQVSELDALAG